MYSAYSHPPIFLSVDDALLHLACSGDVSRVGQRSGLPDGDHELHGAVPRGVPYTDPGQWPSCLTEHGYHAQTDGDSCTDRL